MAEPTSILVADDQSDVLAALQLLLKAEGFRAKAVDSPEAVLRQTAANNFDLVLIDLNYTRDTTSGREGLDLLDQLRAIPNPPPVVVMTAWGSLELAVEAMRRGARDFVLKPWDNDKLIETIRTQIARSQGGRDGVKRQDLEIARQVQAKLFPQRVVPSSTLEYAGRCVQAGVVGGDYFDYLPLGQGHLGLVLADISGKGIAAALLMSNLQAALRSLAQQIQGNLTTLLRTLNFQFRETTETQHFATLFMLDYDELARRMRYVSCGHNPAMLIRAGGTLQRLESTATVLGVLDAFQPAAADVTLASGDLLVIYSDGVTEAPLSNGEEFGESGLADWAQAHRHQAPEEFIDGLVLHLLPDRSAPQYDDLTLLVARCR